jgi:hypothetical protein
METSEAVALIVKELERATIKHPRWPDDKIHAVSIMNEEAGESIRAALNHVYAGEDIEELRNELIQTGAMCIRCLINLGCENEKIQR